MKQIVTPDLGAFNLLPFTGQSQLNAPDGQSAISTTALEDHLMPNNAYGSNLNIQTSVTGLEALKEGKGGCGELLATHFIDRMTKNLRASGRIERFCPYHVATTGSPLSAFAKGTTPFNRMVGFTGEIATLLRSSAYDIGIPFNVLIHGENGVAQTYFDDATTYNSDFSVATLRAAKARGRSITLGIQMSKNNGQFNGQAYYPQVAVSQLKMHREDPYYYLAAPCYLFPRISDNVHWSNVGKYMAAEYLGRLAESILLGNPRVPVTLESATIEYNGSGVATAFLCKFGLPEGRTLTLDEHMLNYLGSTGWVKVDSSQFSRGGFSAYQTNVNYVSTSNPEVVDDDVIRLPILSALGSLSNPIYISLGTPTYGTSPAGNAGLLGSHCYTNVRDDSEDELVVPLSSGNVTVPLWNAAMLGFVQVTV